MLILEERQLLNLETALGIGYKYFIKITKGERGQEKTEDYQPWKQVLEDSRLVSVFFFSRVLCLAVGVPVMIFSFSSSENLISPQLPSTHHQLWITKTAAGISFVFVKVVMMCWRGDVVSSCLWFGNCFLFTFHILLEAIS